MTLSDLLRDLANAGATIRAVHGQIGVTPRSVLTPALREAIREHRVALIRLLEAGDSPSTFGAHRHHEVLATTTCRSCLRFRWWRPQDDPAPDLPPSPASGWTCGHCHPPACPEHAAWAPEVSS